MPRLWRLWRDERRTRTKLASDVDELTDTLSALQARMEHLRANGAFYENIMFAWYGWDNHLRMA